MPRSQRLSVSQKSVLLSLDGRVTATGSLARYAQIDETSGVKLYRWKKVRDMCYNRQEYAYDEGYGPRCWHPFRMRLWNITWLGFYTEHVQTANSIYNRASDGQRRTIHRVHENFKSWLESKFSGMADMSYENFGRLPCGKWVILDFSHLIDDNGCIDRIRPNWRESSCMERSKFVH